MSKCLDEDWHNLKKKDWGDKLEWSEIYPIENWMSDGPYKGGVYFILNKAGSKYHVVYIGQSKCICGRLCDHLSDAIYHEKSGNPLLKKYLKHSFNRENCYFMFVVVRGRAKRNRIERECIEKYKPECNISKGIFKKKKKTRQPRLINIIESFLNKELGYWDFLASDSLRLYCGLVVIGEWDAQVLIIPNTDEGDWRVDKYKEKLRAMAAAQGIKIRNG